MFGEGNYPALAVIACAFITVISLLFFARRRRGKLERRLRDEWGKQSSGNVLTADEMENLTLFVRDVYTASKGSARVDDTTWNDLNMDAIFNYLDRTQSNVGDEALCAMLRDIGANDDELRLRDRWIRALDESASERSRLQLLLRRIGKDRYHGANAFLSRGEQPRLKHGWAYYILAAMPLVFLSLGLINQTLLLGVAVSFIINAIVFYRSQAIWGSKYSAIRHLSKVLNCAVRMRKTDIPGMSDAFDELRALCRQLKPIARWNALYAMQSSNDMDFLTVYLRIAFLLDLISLSRLAAFIRKNKADVVRLYELVGKIDACIAIASVRASLSVYSIPVFTAENAVYAEGISHPLISNPVRNNMVWKENSLITGSNASGKSTFIKALAINAIFAQTICTCWARSFSMPHAQVFSSMALRDDVQNGESYFIVEIKSLHRIIAAIRDDRATLCFIDEILRGTNTIERIASSSSLLHYLRSRNALCVAATHDIEVAQLLTIYKQYHFKEEITPEGMSFSYRLLNGVSDTRNAIKLLEQMEFPHQVVSRADEMARQFTETGKWLLATEETSANPGSQPT